MVKSVVSGQEDQSALISNFRFTNFWSMQFLGKSGKFVCWPPSPRGLAPLPTGNSVSACGSTSAWSPIDHNGKNWMIERKQNQKLLSPTTINVWSKKNWLSFFLTLLDINLSYLTRVHSSRMRTVCCSGCRWRGGIPACTGQGGAYPSMHWTGGYLPREGVCPGVSAQGSCLPRGVSAQGCLPRRGGCLPRCMLGYTPTDRILDTRLQKHYLSATSFADGN